MHWTAVSAARVASRAPELAAKVTSAQEVLPTSGLRAIGMELLEWLYIVLPKCIAKTRNQL